MSGAETKVFWAALVAFPVMWGVMMVVTILTLKFRWFVSIPSTTQVGQLKVVATDAEINVGVVRAMRGYCSTSRFSVEMHLNIL